jgi:hypothetical protein
VGKYSVDGRCECECEMEIALACLAFLGVKRVIGCALCVCVVSGRPILYVCLWAHKGVVA